MAKSKRYVLSVEVYKYPFYGRLDNTEDYLSDKICCYTIRICKKIIKKAKWLIVCGDFILLVTNGVVPSKAIGLPILFETPPITRHIHSNAGLSKKAIIAQVIQDMPAKIVFNKTEMNQLYDLSIKCRDNSISQDELITTLNNLRGGSLVDVTVSLAIIAAIIILANNANGFQSNPHVIVPPHLQWLYGNNYKPGQFGYGKGAGSRSITVIGMAQNAGSDKKQPSSGS
jgi:hypothetical protein